MWVAIGGVIGARLYRVNKDLGRIPLIWRGGSASREVRFD